MNSLLDPIIPATHEAPVRKRGGGPVTPEGIAAASRNSLQHAMYAKILLPDDLVGAIRERTDSLFEEMQPGTFYQEWLVFEMARSSVWVDRCEVYRLRDLERTKERARLSWEEDRRLAAAELGARLSRDPARVALALGGSKQGADWLIERWEALGEILKHNGSWTEAQRRLAADMLGLPADLRDNGSRLPAESDTAALAALVTAELSRLRHDRETALKPLDEAERSLALEGLAVYEDATTTRLRRHEAQCRRNLKWARAEWNRVRAEASKGAEAPPVRPDLPDDHPFNAPRNLPPELPCPDPVSPPPSPEPEPEAESAAEPEPRAAAPVWEPSTSTSASLSQPRRPEARNRRERRAAAAQARRGGAGGSSTSA